jgi:hypothetical protein
VDINGLSKRLLAFCVVGVNDLPRRQHEHGGMERVGSEHGFQLDGRQRQSLVKHAKRIDQPAIEENPLRSARLIEVLLNVSTQDLLSESKSIWSTTDPARKVFCDDGPSGLFDGCVAHGGELSQERRLARTRPAGDDDMRHRFLESATPNDYPVHFPTLLGYWKVRERGVDSIAQIRDPAKEERHMNIGEPLRTIIVEPLELPVEAPAVEPDPEPEQPEPEPEPVPANV